MVVLHIPTGRFLYFKPFAIHLPCFLKYMVTLFLLDMSQIFHDIPFYSFCDGPFFQKFCYPSFRAFLLTSLTNMCMILFSAIPRIVLLVFVVPALLIPYVMMAV